MSLSLGESIRETLPAIPNIWGNPRSSGLVGTLSLPGAGQVQAHEPVFAAQVEPLVREHWRSPTGIVQLRDLEAGNFLWLLRIELEEPQQAAFAKDD